MKRNATQRSSTDAEIHAPSFQAVLDSRKRKVPGLWIRNGRYYAQLRIDLGNGRTAPRRIALVATWTMIRKGHIDDTLKLAAQVLDDTEDLIHKATGWMLREVGKRDMAALKRFLRKHYARMPRTALRYAIERFPKAERLRYLKGSF